MEYNARLLSYPIGNHVTIYNKTFSRGENVNNKRNENFNKGYKNLNRSVLDSKHCLDVSASRAKNTVYQIARANAWDWFITLTFDRSKTDSSDYDVILKRLHIFLNNLKKRSCPDLKYLIVPELHSDGEHYHFHGLISNCDGLKFKLWKVDKNGNPIFNITNWKWGYTTASRIQDNNKVSSYICKYITKDVDVHLAEKNRYFHSRNCDMPVELLDVTDEESIMEHFGGSIQYVKSVNVSAAHLKCKYFEISD
jgi:hypothetical protein